MADMEPLAGADAGPVITGPLTGGGIRPVLGIDDGNAIIEEFGRFGGGCPTELSS
ncbi:MAG: hypothetical protein RL215_2903, partial [Planctomycetota bacterium]